MALNSLLPNDIDFEEYDLDTFYKYCPGHDYIPTILPPQPRIIAIGDLHGDLDLTLRCLKLAKVIDNKGNWIGGKTIVVQTGDKVDGCRPIPGVNSCGNGSRRNISSETSMTNSSSSTNNTASSQRPDLNDSEEYNADDDIKILELFYDLHKKAKPHGGAVYSLLGNHELMNVEGNLKYVSKKALEQFADYNDGKINFKEAYSYLSPKDRGVVARRYAFSPGNKWAKFLACTNIGCMIIGSFLFVHAGIVPQFIADLNIKTNKDLTKINHLVRLWLLDLIKKDQIHKIVAGESSSLFWERVLGNLPSNLPDTDNRCKQYLDPVLKLFNIGNMVIGHTPQFSSGINGSCSNKVLRIDTGSSVAFKSFDKLMSTQGNITRRDFRSAQVLEIINDKVINILK